jgi:hypothetical protein
MTAILVGPAGAAGAVVVWAAALRTNPEAKVAMIASELFI